MSRYVLPNLVTKIDNNLVTEDPYSRLFRDRIVYLGSQVDDVASNDLISQLLTLESMDQEEDIYMYINSPGGSLSDMHAIVNTMQYVSPNVHTICLGMAASAAAVIFAAGAKRLIQPGSQVMIHQPRSGQSGHGQASDIQIQADQFLKSRKDYATYLAEFSGKSYEDVNRDIERDRWLSAEEAVAYGIADEILKPKNPRPVHKVS